MGTMIGSYRICEQIHESPSSCVHRGQRSDGSEVIVKTPAPGVAVVEFTARLRHELLVSQMFDSPHLIKAEELVEHGGVGLVFESVPGAVPLSERGRGRALSVVESLAIALGIVDALATLHARNIVHKDVKPDNVLVNQDLSRVVLIDLGVAAIVPRDLARAQPNTKLEGTLKYMPPEQTGRVNRAIDHRSDYYALGATLHWMLTGASPFEELREPNQLVHAHLARAPPLVHELDPELPPVLGRIVAKLLSKSAEERYQGSFGLRADLHRCLDALDAGQLEDFEIARVDPAEQLRLPHHHYGRERQLATLAGLFDEIQGGEQSQLQVLRGASGSGKTTLVREFQHSLDLDVIYASGKFEQYGHGESYTAVSEALRAILARLTDAESSRELLLARVREAVGQNVALPTPRAALHLAIARGLSHRSGIRERGELRARIAEHVGRAIELIDSPTERERFAKICRSAGQRAKATAAFSVAASNYAHALQLMDADGARSEDARRQLLATIVDHGECLYMSGELGGAAEAFAKARELVDGRAEMIELLFDRARLLMVRGDTEGALGITMEVAELYELDLVRGGSQEWVAMMDTLLARLRTLSPEDIAAGPLLEDREQMVLGRLLQFSVYSSFGLTDFSLCAALVTTAITLSLDHGITDTTGICFVHLAGMLAALDDHEAAAPVRDRPGDPGALPGQLGQRRGPDDLRVHDARVDRASPEQPRAAASHLSGAAGRGDDDDRRLRDLLTADDPVLHRLAAAHGRRGRARDQGLRQRDLRSHQRDAGQHRVGRGARPRPGVGDARRSVADRRRVHGRGARGRHGDRYLLHSLDSGVRAAAPRRRLRTRARGLAARGGALYWGGGRAAQDDLRCHAGGPRLRSLRERERR